MEKGVAVVVRVFAIPLSIPSKRLINIATTVVFGAAVKMELRQQLNDNPTRKRPPHPINR